MTKNNNVMTDSLTARQIQILRYIISEYIDTAEPVGSDSLEKKYDLGVSPATVRNEMVALTKKGYLRQPHTSAGRIPSPKAMKFYVDQLMEEKQMSLTDEVKAKEEVWDARGNLDDLISEATVALASRTGSLVIGIVDPRKVFHSGYSNIFLSPEFADLQICSNLFELLEEAQRIDEIFFNKLRNDSAVEVLFGEELGWADTLPISIVARSFVVGNKRAALGVIGPTRTSYNTIIPTLRYFGDLIQEVSQA